MAYKDKEKQNAQARKWYAANKEKAKEYRKKYRDKTPKEIRLKYYYDNIEEYKEKSKIYREKNKEKIAATKKIIYERNKDKIFPKHLEKTYGITIEEFNKITLEQKGVCKICQQIPTERLRVDHNHTTGKVRALLCNTCNLGLGYFKDNIPLLREAINYLNLHKEEKVIESTA